MLKLARHLGPSRPTAGDQEAHHRVARVRLSGMLNPLHKPNHAVAQR